MVYLPISVKNFISVQFLILILHMLNLYSFIILCCTTLSFKSFLYLQEGGSTRRSPSYLDYKEEELISKCKIEKYIIEKIDQHIKVQLLWTKHHPKET